MLLRYECCTVSANSARFGARSKAAGISRHLLDEKEGDADSEGCDRLCDVPLRPDRELPADGSLRVGERPRMEGRGAKGLRGEKTPFHSQEAIRGFA